MKKTDYFANTTPTLHGKKPMQPEKVEKENDKGGESTIWYE